MNKAFTMDTRCTSQWFALAEKVAPANITYVVVFQLLSVASHCTQPVVSVDSACAARLLGVSLLVLGVQRQAAAPTIVAKSPRGLSGLSLVTLEER